MNINFSIFKFLLFFILSVILILLIKSVNSSRDFSGDVVVTYINNTNYSRITKKDIKDLAINFLNTRDSLGKDINISLLEDLISQDQYIKKAEVYLNLDGVMNIYVYFREPFIRFLAENEICYFDKEGVKLPVLTDVNQDLLIVGGNIFDGKRDALYSIVNIIYSHPFLNKIIGALYYDNNLGYVMSGKVCDLKIQLGEYPVVDQAKINMIKTFYNFLLLDSNCNYCDLIDIRYDNQIICVK